MFLNREYLIKCLFIKKEGKKIFLTAEMLNENEEVCILADFISISSDLREEKKPLFFRAKF